jgi:hypothetical protein
MLRVLTAPTMPHMVEVASRMGCAIVGSRVRNWLPLNAHLCNDRLNERLQGEIVHSAQKNGIFLLRE